MSSTAEKKGRRLRAVYMTDDDFDLCSAVAGARKFSSWASAALVGIALSRVGVPGAVPGSPCECGRGPTRFFCRTVSKRLCAECAAPILESYSHTVVDESSQAGRLRSLLDAAAETSSETAEQRRRRGQLLSRLRDLVGELVVLEGLPGGLPEGLFTAGEEEQDGGQS